MIYPVKCKADFVWLNSHRFVIDLDRWEVTLRDLYLLCWCSRGVCVVGGLLKMNHLASVVVRKKDFTQSFGYE